VVCDVDESAREIVVVAAVVSAATVVAGVALERRVVERFEMLAFCC
jgi:hypothetical protein